MVDVTRPEAQRGVAAASPASLAPVPPALPPGGLAHLMAPEPVAPTKRWRVAYVVSHPIQYQAPLLRHLTAASAVDVQTLFLSDLSVGPYRDRGFGRDVEWDVDLLGGYPHRFLAARGRTDRLGLVRPWAADVERELEQGAFDALWLHGYAHATHLRALRAARRLGIPVLLRGESLLVGRRERGPRAWLRERLLPRVLERVDAALAIGSANRAFYRSYGFPDERIFDAPYAVDNDRFRRQALAAAPRREALRRRLGLEPGRPVVLYASKLSARKRPLDLLAAVERLLDRRDGPHPQLVIAGDGELRGSVEAAARRLGPRHVRLVGFRNQTELPRLYDLCDAFCLPSAFEPWGLVVNEAMNAGRPVVASDRVGSALDLVREDETGATFPMGDVAALADALARVLRDPGHARELGRRAAARVAGFDFAAVGRGLEAALGQVAGAPR